MGRCGPCVSCTGAGRARSSLGKARYRCICGSVGPHPHPDPPPPSSVTVTTTVLTGVTAQNSHVSSGVSREHTSCARARAHRLTGAHTNGARTRFRIRNECLQPNASACSRSLCALSPSPVMDQHSTVVDLLAQTPLQPTRSTLKAWRLARSSTLEPKADAVEMRHVCPVHVKLSDTSFTDILLSFFPASHVNDSNTQCPVSDCQRYHAFYTLLPDFFFLLRTPLE